MNTRYFRFWKVLLLAASISIGFASAACGPPAPKKIGEECKTVNDCDANLTCTGGKCVAARLPDDTRLPVANAGDDKSIKVGEEVTLDGSKSSSIEGKTLTYTWTLRAPEGSAATLQGADQASPRFTPDKVGTYTATLVVKDTKESAPDEVQIFVATNNRAPVADAGQNVRVEAGTKVDLDGSKSSDPDNDPLTYSWEVFRRPTGSTAALTDASGAKPSFTPDRVGSYGLRLTVSDGSLSASATVFIEAVINNPAPELTSLSPNGGAAKVKLNVQINGKNFLFGLKLFFDTQEITSFQFKGSDQLIVPLDLTAIPVGTYKIKVINPDTKESNALDFNVVEGNAPTITKISPSLLITGQSLRLEIEGTNFLPGAKVVFNNQDLPTQFASATKVSAALTAPAPGEYDLKVVNPDAKETPVSKVAVSGVQAILSRLSLTRMGEDCVKETITVWGQNFQPGLTAELVDRADPTKTFAPTKLDVISLTEIRLEYDFTKVPRGAYDVVVKNPETPASKPLPFRVTAPPGKPEIFGVYPQKFFYGSTLSVFVVGFNLDESSSVVSTNLQGSLKKAFNPITYEIEFNTAQITQAGKLTFELTASCGRKSDPIEVEAIDESKPTITGPKEIVLGFFGASLRLTGADFGLNPIVTINGTAVTPVTRIDDFALEIPSAAFTAEGEYKVVVENKGGVKSDEFTIKVVGSNPDMEIFEVAPDGIGFYDIVSVNTTLASTNAPIGKPYVLFSDSTGATVCTQNGIPGTNFLGDIYVSQPFRCDPSGTAMIAGEVYQIRVIKVADDGTINVSPPFDYTLDVDSTTNSTDWPARTGPGGGSGGTTPTATPPLPHIHSLNPASIIPSIGQTTVKFAVRGALGATTDTLDVYLNGVKLDTTVDAAFALSARTTSSVEVTITTPATETVHRVEVANPAGRSNALQLNVDAVGKARLKGIGTFSSTIYPSILNTDEVTSAPQFDLHGDFLRQTGQRYFINGVGYTASGTAPHSIYAFGPNLATVKAFSGFITAHVSDANDVKISNDAPFLFINNASGGWGSYNLPLRIENFADIFADFLGSKVKLRIVNQGFIADDGQGNKGEILFDGQAAPEPVNSAATATRFAYVDSGELDIQGEPRVVPVQLKNPDGTTSSKLYFSILEPNSPIIRNYTVGGSETFNFAAIVRPNTTPTLRLTGAGFTANTKFYFAGRVANGTVTSSSAANVTIDVRGLSGGYHPLWFEEAGVGSNTIFVRVFEGSLPAVTVPKFQGISPFYLDQRLVTANSTYRFFVLGEGLNEDLELVIGGKKGSLKRATTATTGRVVYVAEVDLSGLAVGNHDVYLENAALGYTSPKFRLEIYSETTP